MSRTPLIFILLAILIMSVAAQNPAPESTADPAPTAGTLVNPGFEAPFLTQADLGDIAQGWSAWRLIENADSSQPFYQAAGQSVTPARVATENESQKIFFFLGSGTGGLSQTVSGLTGNTATFSIQAYVWSSSDESNPDLSADPGIVTIEVGIDPTGDSSPTASTIVWSDPVEQYDAFNTYTVSTPLSGDTLTVYVRVSVAEARLYTDVFIDDATLIIGDETAPIATEEATEAVETTEVPTEEVTEEATLEVTVTSESANLVETPTLEPVPTETLIELPTVEMTPTPDPIVQQETELAATNVAVSTELVLTATGQAIITETAQAEQGALFAGTSTAIAETQIGFEQQATELIQTVTQSALEAESTRLAAEQLATAALQPTQTLVIVEPTFTPVVIEPTATDFLPTPVPTNTEVLATPTDISGTPIPLSEEFPGRLLHTVTYGDTVADIAVLYNSTVEAIISANGLGEDALIFVGQGLIIPVRIPPPATSTPTHTPQVIVVTATPDQSGVDASGFYVVQPGDNLSTIARRFNTTMTTLAQLNGIVNYNRILVGQRLQLPTGTSAPNPAATPVPTATAQPTVNYTVQLGDSLYTIALRYNVTIQRLVEVNRIENPNRIFVGQVLVIPQ
ncbi:MAG: LysM peptidoglycan-binding domain-containing protein [Anaerolineae bacterium]|nr:LysM peptidoglycan-binding domain-containing protein [Anaerolineae bacterium]